MILLSIMAILFFSKTKEKRIISCDIIYLISLTIGDDVIWIEKRMKVFVQKF